MRSSGALQAGHRLVLAEGSTISACVVSAMSPVLQLLVHYFWQVNEQLDVSGALTFSGGGWGDEVVRLVDVSNCL